MALLTLLGAVCVSVSFGAGMKLSGDVQTVGSTQAGDVLLGDMDESGTLDQYDVQIILEIAEQNRTPTAHQLRADPNQDGELTVEDAMRLLRELQTP